MSFIVYVLNNSKSLKRVASDLTTHFVCTGTYARPGRQAATEDQDLQETDRGGGGDRRSEPRQVPQGTARAGRS